MVIRPSLQVDLHPISVIHVPRKGQSMSELQRFGLALQTLAIEHGRYKAVREKGEEDAKRRMYALEKRHKAGEALEPTELCFLLNMQDKYIRAPAIPDPPIVVPTLEQLIDEATAKDVLRKDGYIRPTFMDRAFTLLLGLVLGVGVGLIVPYLYVGTIFKACAVLALLFAFHGVNRSDRQEGEPS